MDYEESAKPVVQKLTDSLAKFFGVDMLKASTHAKLIQKQVPLDTDLSDILGFAIPNAPAICTEELPRSIVSKWKNLLAINVTLHPASSYTSSPNYTKLISADDGGYFVENYKEHNLSLNQALGTFYLTVSPVLKLTKELAQYISQSDPISLRQLHTWFRKFLDYSVRRKTKTEPPNSVPFSSLNKIPAIRKSRNLHTSGTQADENGFISDLEGAQRWLPAPEVISDAIQKNTEEMEAAYEELYQVAAELGTPIAADRNSVSGERLLRDSKADFDKFTKNYDRAVELRSKLRECCTLPLAISWDLGVVCSTDAELRMNTESIAGAAKQDTLSEGGMLDGVFRKRLLRAMKNLRTADGKFIDEVRFNPSSGAYASFTAAKSLVCVAVYAYGMGVFKLKTVEEYIKLAAEKLGFARWRSGKRPAPRLSVKCFQQQCFISLFQQRED